MEKLIDKLWALAFGKTARWFWASIILLVLFALVLFPYIDANIFAPQRLGQRVEFLEKLIQLDETKIKSIPELNAEYNAVLADLNATREKSIGKFSSSQTSQEDYFIKFFGSGVFFYILAIVNLIITKAFRNKIMGFFAIAVLGGLWGWVCAAIPTIATPWAHAIASAVLSFILLVLLLAKLDNKKAERNGKH
jgi:hypothetical protein